MSDVQIRYSRVSDRSPKNTLVTKNVDGTIYFGIARCNKKKDVFARSVGRMIASKRAEFASDKTCNKMLCGTEISIGESGLYGSVPSDHVGELVRYFRDIDVIMLERK